VTKRATTEPRGQRVFPEKLQIRHVREGIFGLDGDLGFSTRSVVRFSEVTSGQRWRRCASVELEVVVTDLGRLVGRGQVRNDRADTATQDVRAELGRRSA
jgi:hypothetical protein